MSVLLAILFWASPNAKQAGIKWVSPGGVLGSAIFLRYSGLRPAGETAGQLADIVMPYLDKSPG